MTTVSQRLHALHSERGQLVTAFENAIQPSIDSSRDLDDTETDVIDALQSQIETVDKQIDRWQKAETLLSRQVAQVPATIPGIGHNGGPRFTQMRRLDDYKGAGFTRWAIATAVAGPWSAGDYARQRWGDDDLADVIRQAAWLGRAPTAPGMAGGGAINPPASTVGDTGGFLVRLEHLGSEFIELLRPMLIVARLPSMRRLTFDSAGTLLIPRQNGGVVGGYVGEGQLIAVNRLTFGQLQLTPSKLAVIVPTTNELLHRADPGLEQIIRDDMLAGTARTIDTVFFSTAAAGPGGVAPPAGILNGITQVPIMGGAANPSVDQVTIFLRSLITALRLNNVPMLAPVWVMNARTKEFIRLIRTQATEIFAFKAEIDAGTLLGYPIIDSTNIAIPFPPGTGTNTAMALIDASQLIWAEDMMPMIDASQDASILSADMLPPDGRPDPEDPQPSPEFPGYSAFQNDMTFLRIRMRHTWARRHDVAVAWGLTGA